MLVDNDVDPVTAPPLWGQGPATHQDTAPARPPALESSSLTTVRSLSHASQPYTFKGTEVFIPVCHGLEGEVILLRLICGEKCKGKKQVVWERFDARHIKHLSLKNYCVTPLTETLNHHLSTHSTHDLFTNLFNINLTKQFLSLSQPEPSVAAAHFINTSPWTWEWLVQCFPSSTLLFKSKYRHIMNYSSKFYKGDVDKCSRQTQCAAALQWTQ